MSQRLRAGGSEQPFYYVTVAVAAVLRAKLTGKRLTTARAIYDALAEISNEQRSSEFRAARGRLARYAGVTDRTVDAYGRLFVRLGLLEVAQSTGAANTWRLLEPDPITGGEAKRTGEARHAPRSSDTGRAKPTTEGGEASSTRFKKNGKEEKKVLHLRSSNGDRRRQSDDDAERHKRQLDGMVKPG